MFTGIIQSFGYLEEIDKKENIYKIKTNLNLQNCVIGSSICCDGVCLTATIINKIDSGFSFNVNVGEETINKSNLSNWIIGNKINLEKSLRVGDEISGHFVYGHVDCTMGLKTIKYLENSWEFEFLFFDNSYDIRKFVVKKGSIAINGVSLTIANVLENSFNVSVVPHTFKNTNLSNLKEKDVVNIEFDPLARYINNRYDS